MDVGDDEGIRERIVGMGHGGLMGARKNPLLGMVGSL